MLSPVYSGRCSWRPEFNPWLEFLPPFTLKSVPALQLLLEHLEGRDSPIRFQPPAVCLAYGKCSTNNGAEQLLLLLILGMSFIFFEPQFHPSNWDNTIIIVLLQRLNGKMGMVLRTE